MILDLQITTAILFHDGYGNVKPQGNIYMALQESTCGKPAVMTDTWKLLRANVYKAKSHL